MTQKIQATPKVGAPHEQHHARPETSKPQPPSGDQTHISPDARGEEDPANPEHLTGLMGNFSTQDGGPIDLVNPSAPVEKAVGEILSSLGEGLPDDLELGTHISATPIGGGRLVGQVDRSLQLEGLRPALSSLDGLISQAEAGYKGKLPPKVAQHVEMARAAAARAGIS